MPKLKNNITLDEAINQFEYYRKKVITEYRMLELNKDFGEMELQDKFSYYVIHLYDYVSNNVIPFINKEEFSKLSYYINNNILLEDTPEFSYYSMNQRNILRHLAIFKEDEYAQI